MPLFIFSLLCPVCFVAGANRSAYYLTSAFLILIPLGLFLFLVWRFRHLLRKPKPPTG